MTKTIISKTEAIRLGLVSWNTLYRWIRSGKIDEYSIPLKLKTRSDNYQATFVCREQIEAISKK